MTQQSAIRAARKRLETEEAKRRQQGRTDEERAAKQKTKQAVAERVALCAEMAASGHTKKQIAAYLFVDERTVWNYLDRLRKEMEYEATVQEMGPTRTKRAVAHGHDVRDAEDKTLAGDIRLGVRGALWTLERGKIAKSDGLAKGER